jgi:hypothetical protein
VENILLKKLGAAMPKHPPLTIVPPVTNSVPPPRSLGIHGLKLWNSVQAEYRIEDCGGVEILAQACIDTDGSVIRTRNGVPKAHPACRDEIAARGFVVRTLQKLGLNFEPVKSPGRPPKPFGWTGDE